LHTCVFLNDQAILMRITIKDIARELNVHHSTVSRAIRMDPRIKSETGEIIRNYAREHGYYANLNALRLRNSLRNVIALIVPNINHRFFSNIINYLADLCYEKDYILSIYQSNENFDHERSFIKKLIQQDVAGVIASISDKTKTSDHFRELNKLNIPLVFFDRVLDDIQASRVTVNNREVVESVVDKLWGMDRSRIAHISGPDHISVFHNRNEGYLSGIRKVRSDYAKSICIEEQFSPESGRKAALELFSPDTRPDAIISTSFFLTMGIVRYLNEIDVMIPDEVTIAGFGDRMFNSLLSPGIISIDQPEKEMALVAFDLLLEQIEYKGEPGKFIYKDIELKSEILT
jgi:LacI family transcriptional regulator